jgi:membrane-bound lytic murein transglycosylase A
MTPGLRAALAAGLLAASALAGCAPERLEYPRYATPAAHRSTASTPPPARSAAGGSGVSSLANLPGWAEEDHAAALAALQAGCGVSTEPDMQAACSRARALGPASEAVARRFLEDSFRPVILAGPGLLTGYFAPEYPARNTPDAVFSAAVRPKPSDLVAAPADPDQPLRRPVLLQRGEDGRTWPYPDRAGIELTPATDALAYMRPEDLFFLQIQGSGVLDFPDGRRMKASYAADNGRPFVAIAALMTRRGLLAPGQASAGSIRTWLRTHAGAEAETLMDADPRYVFFSLQPDDGREPAGAAGVPLRPGRSIAVDPAWHPYGELFWIDGAAPMLNGAVRSYRRLVMALDTGSAIRGDVRADLYVGRGDQAGVEAGRIRHTLLMVRLVPVDLGAAPPARGYDDEAPAAP